MTTILDNEELSKQSCGSTTRNISSEISWSVLWISSVWFSSQKHNPREKYPGTPTQLTTFISFINMRLLGTSSRATLSSAILKVRNCGKNWVVTSYIASQISADDVHINYFHRRQSPACLRSWTQLNFAGKRAVNARDRLCVGNKCSHMPQRCPRPCRRHMRTRHNKFAYLTVKNHSFYTLCKCVFHFWTFRCRSCSFHDVKWSVFQLCGRREHTITIVHFCLLISEALVPI